MANGITRARVHGNDVPFMKWFRNNPRFPSSPTGKLPWVGVVTTDSDVIIHRYYTRKYRKHQWMFDLEIKSRLARPRPSQRDTLWKRNLFAGSVELPGGKYGDRVTYLGAFVVSYSGTGRPDESSLIRWGRFPHKNSDELEWTVITLKQLEDILLFELHPVTLEPTELMAGITRLPAETL